MQKYGARYPDKAYCLNSHLGPFGLTIESMGFEYFCYSLYDDRDLVKSILDKRAHWFIEICQYVESLGVDFLIMGDDVAFKQKTFVSTRDFKELAIPCYERIVESLSIPVFWHSEGYIEPLIGLAIEAGIKGLHAIGPLAGNDLGRIKQKYGDKLVLLGNVDCIEVLTQNDLERVRKDVDRCIAAAKAGGGFILSSASFHGQCKLEALVEMFRYAKIVARY
jgi:uroporphyrinogen decarboxylase